MKHILFILIFVGTLLQTMAFTELSTTVTDSESDLAVTFNYIEDEPLAKDNELSVNRIADGKAGDALRKYVEDFIVANKENVAILKNSKTTLFRDFFVGYFFELMNKDFKEEFRLYKISLYDPLKLQKITRKIVDKSVILACKAWHRYHIAQVKRFIDDEVRTYRENRGSTKRDYDDVVAETREWYSEKRLLGQKTRAQEKGRLIELAEAHDSKQEALLTPHLVRLNDLKDRLTNVNELYEHSIDKRNKFYLEVLDIKDYLY